MGDILFIKLNWVKQRRWN